MGLSRRRFLSLILLVVAVSVLLSGVSPVQALRVKDPVLRVSVPSTPVLTGLSVSSRVSVNSVLSPLAYNSFDVVVKADPLVLNPTRIIVGSALPSPIITTYCINGAGINCGLKDGPGIAHLAVSSATNGVNGTLFRVVWRAVNGVGSFGTVGTTVTIPCFVVALNSIPISPTLFSVVTGTYGTVPASAQPTATISVNQTSITIKTGTSHNVTVTVTGVNGFSSRVGLSASTSAPSTSITATFAATHRIATIVSCDCGTKPTPQLTINPKVPGSYTVQVFERIGTTLVTIDTISVTAN